jgi:hypothetical protein
MSKSYYNYLEKGLCGRCGNPKPEREKEIVCEECRQYLKNYNRMRRMHISDPLKYPISVAWKQRTKTTTKTERTNKMQTDNNNIMAPRKINRMGRGESIQLALKLAPKKEEIQARFNKGMTAVDYAKELNIAPQPLRQILDIIGVQHSNRFANRPTNIGPLETRVVNLERAVKQIFEELGVTPKE